MTIWLQMRSRGLFTVVASDAWLGKLAQKVGYCTATSSKKPG